MKLPDMHSATGALRATLWRFPVAALCALAFTLVAMASAHFRSSDASALVTTPTLFVQVYGCFGSIALRLLAEQHPARRAWIYGGGMLLGLAAVYWVASGLSYQQMLTAAAFSVLLMYASPYLLRGSSNDAMWTFCFRLSLHIALTFAIAVLLFAGLMFIHSGVTYLLLEKQYYGQSEIYLWFLVACLFSPLFAMAGIPRDFTAIQEEYPKLLRVVVSYIVLPLWAAYLLVLYLYMGKILLLWELPKGAVAYLVSGFGVVTIAIYLKAYPLFRAQAGVIVRLFGRYAFPLLVPPLLLLAFAVSERIRAYGITEDRYLLVLSLLWLVSCVILRWRDDTQAPRRMLLLALALCGLSLAGPWGMSSVTTMSQLSRFTSVLERTHILVNGRITKATSEPSPEDIAQVSDGIDYFIDHNKSAAIRHLFANPEAVFTCDEGCLKNGRDHERYSADVGIKDHMADAMGVPYFNYWRRQDSQSVKEAFVHQLTYEHKEKVIAVKGYDYALDIEFPHYGGGTDCHAPTAIALPGSDQQVTVDCPAGASTCTMQIGEKATLIFRIAEYISTQKTTFKYGESSLAGPLQLEAEDHGAQGKLIITNLYGSMKQGNKPVITSIEGKLLLKLGD